MPVLHFGVIDIPYTEFDNGKPKKRKKSEAPPPTTGDVAEWLENKYHIMEIFYKKHEKEISAYIEADLKGQFANILAGISGQNTYSLNESTAKMESDLKRFISSREAEQSGIKGTPTQAALDGINHRFKNPKTGVRRPSFRDTGQYMASMKVWSTKK